MKQRRRLPTVVPRLPPMRCDKGCGACCGPVPVDRVELAAIEAYAAAHGVFPEDRGLSCPYYQRGVCAVYPVRPRVCQAFGHTPRLVCERGYQAHVDDEHELMRWVLGDGEVVGLLPELVLNKDPIHG